MTLHETHRLPGNTAEEFGQLLDSMRDNKHRVMQPLKNSGHYIEGPEGCWHYRYYEPKGKAEAMIVALHGAANNSGFFHDFAMQAALSRYVVCAFDFPGHGYSYHAKDYDLFKISDGLVDVLGKVKNQEQHKNLKLFGLGASFGGQMLMTTADRVAYEAVAINDIGPRVHIPTHKLVMNFIRAQETHNAAEMIGYCGRKYHHYGFSHTEGAQEFIQGLMQKNETNDYCLNVDKGFADIYPNVDRYPHIVVDRYRDPTTKEIIPDMNLMPYFVKMTMPKMILRGQESGFFTEGHLQEMLENSGDTVKQVIRVAKVKHPVAMGNKSLNAKVLNFFDAYKAG